MSEIRDGAALNDDDNPSLLAYMWLITALAVPLVALTAVQAFRGSWQLGNGQNWLTVTIFSLVLILGEMKPIPVARGEEAGDEITTSSTFGFALLLLAPVVFTIAAQAIALTIDWKVRGARWHRLPFNIGQYAIAFIGARGIYAITARQPFTPLAHVPLPDLGPAVLAGVTFLLLNNTLVGVAIASRVMVPLRQVLLGDLTWQITTSAPLLALAPLAAAAAAWTPASIVLLLIPIAALHFSGQLAMRREQEALRDPLTKLANRTMLATAAERALQSPSSITAILLVDLDHFKDINDTLGHAVGDTMLLTVAERLTENVGPLDLVARLGGDEFAILVRGASDNDSVVLLAERLGFAIRQPLTVQGVTLTVGCSIGIGFGREHASTVEGLMRCADVALYAAKVARGTVAVYDKHNDRHSVARLGLQADLRAALENDEDSQVFVAYQPQLQLLTGTVTSVECLVRWQHPDLGELLPDTFIPIAESTPLIDLLMRRVLDLALTQLAAWDEQGLRLTACVNLSARQLSDQSLPETIGQQLARHGIAAERLVIEVTESRLMSDPERSADILQRLHAMGVQVSIDDFGTGYSSLAHLQRLEVDELKIDKSFVAGLRDSSDTTIIRSTIELGHNLGLRVVAEGIEDQETADLLYEMGCDLLQGYFVGRPTTPAAFVAAIRDSLPQIPAEPHRFHLGDERRALAFVPPQGGPVGDVAAPSLRKAIPETR